MKILDNILYIVYNILYLWGREDFYAGHQFVKMSVSDMKNRGKHQLILDVAAALALKIIRLPQVVIIYSVVLT